MFVLEPDTDTYMSWMTGIIQKYLKTTTDRSSITDSRGNRACTVWKRAPAKHDGEWISFLSERLCMWVQLTEVIPILLHVLDLQLVAALSEDGFRVLLKPSGQDSSMPGPSVDPSVHVDHHYKHTTHSAATHTCFTNWTNHTYYHHLKYAKPESATHGDFTRQHDDVRRCSKSGIQCVAKW